MKLNTQRYILTLAGLGALFSISGGTHAAAIGVEVSAGSTGLGLHASLPLKKELNFRFGFNALSLATVLKDPNGDTSINISLKTLDALLDWFPLNNAFQLTAGLVYNGNKIDTVTNINGVTYKGTVFNPTFGNLGQVDGNFKVSNVISPYLGIGWRSNLNHEAGWSFASEFGLLFHGKPKISLQSTGCTADFVSCTLVAQKVAEEEVKINDEYSDKIVFPVARIAVNYSF